MKTEYWTWIILIIAFIFVLIAGIILDQANKESITEQLEQLENPAFFLCYGTISVLAICILVLFVPRFHMMD